MNYNGKGKLSKLIFSYGYWESLKIAYQICKLNITEFGQFSKEIKTDTFILFHGLLWITEKAIKHEFSNANVFIEMVGSNESHNRNFEWNLFFQSHYNISENLDSQTSIRCRWYISGGHPVYLNVLLYFLLKNKIL